MVKEKEWEGKTMEEGKQRDQPNIKAIQIGYVHPYAPAKAASGRREPSATAKWWFGVWVIDRWPANASCEQRFF